MRNSEMLDEYSAILGVSHIIKPDLPCGADTSGKYTLQYWQNLKEDAMNCTKCPLAKTRKNVVFGDGNINADLMFIGEGPGADEDEQGLPFVGKAGKLLTKMIAAMGYNRSDVYIANVVKCRPPGNRNPNRAEAEACTHFLEKQVNLIRPKVIVCLGSVAAMYFLGSDTQITKLRGRFFEYLGIKVMPTFHPAYLLRDESKKKEVWSDLKVVMNFLDK
jgi:DNA polymerase